MEEKPTRTQIHARIPSELVDAIDSNARSLGVDRSCIVQTAIAHYLEHFEQIPVQLRYADIERRLYDLELIVRSRPNKNNGK